MRLRRKLDESYGSGAGASIEAVRGFGYRYRVLLVFFCPRVEECFSLM
jgi:hypothetical protein